jgi:serine/threonine protein kinase
MTVHASHECPGSEFWHALADDVVAPAEREDFERHLRSCETCRRRIDQADGLDEPMRALARQVGDPTGAPRDTTLVNVMERLQDVRSLVSPTPGDAADLYFLQPSDKPETIGTLAEYEVQEVIGQGGMGVVLKAYEPALHRLVAIKVLSPALAGSASARQRFTREAQAAAAISHDHIVVVHGVHETAGLPYLVMKYIAGESLQQRIDRGGPLDVIEIVRIGLQTASGLAAAHAQGLIHRDIKPANLLLENGLARVTITDFGLARLVDDVGLTQNGAVAGTPEYMAPEQARGEAIDPRADLFTLGSVLYAMCTGVPPFQAPTTLGVMRQVCEETPKPIRSLNPNTPEWLELLIGRMMAKDPAGRFQSATEVAALLEGYLAHLREPTAIAAPSFRPAPERGGARHARRMWMFFMGAVAAVALLVIPRVAFQPASPPVPPPGGVEVYQDFRQAQPLSSSFYLVGPDVQTVARPEEGGLRLTLPAKRERHHPVAVQATLALCGDFEVTGSYEILSAQPPANGYGTGVSLNVADNDQRLKFAKSSRVYRPDEGSVYFAQYWSRGVRPDYKVRAMPSTVRTGKLRLERTGPTIRMLVADGLDPEFHEISRIPHFGTEDLAHLRFEVADSGEPGNPVDVRLLDLRVRAANMVLPELASNPGSPAQLRKAGGGKGWLTAVMLATLGVSICVVGLWLRARRQSGRAVGTSPAPGSDEPAVASSTRMEPGLTLPAWLARPVCLLVFSVIAACAIATGLGYAVAYRAGASAALDLEFYRSLKDDAENRASFELRGPNAERCVQFEPDGLRITLPDGYPKLRPMVGVSAPLAVKGDFEITVDYDILHEPAEADGVHPAMKVWLMAVVDNFQDNPAVMGRIISKEGEPRYTMWQTVWNYEARDNHTSAKQLPTQAKSGRLRLVRTGSDLRYYAAEGPDGEFALLQEFPFTDEDLKSVRILCSTGGPKSSVDVRVANLRVRTSSAAAGEAPVDVTSGVLAGLATLIMLAGGGGIGLVAYRRRPTSAEASGERIEAPALAETALRLAFRCSACQARLKVNAELAGKRVKCPQCEAANLVPAAQATAGARS